MYNPSFTGTHSSPKERHLQKCCVSFGKECNISNLYDPLVLVRKENMDKEKRKNNVVIVGLSEKEDPTDDPRCFPGRRCYGATQKGERLDGVVPNSEDRGRGVRGRPLFPTD